MRRLLVSGARETVGRSSISMIRYGWLRGYGGEAKVRGGVFPAIKRWGGSRKLDDFWIP
ncbi:MAG: hypothetical protein WCP70_10880 [Methanothrix sp.]